MKSWWLVRIMIKILLEKSGDDDLETFVFACLCVLNNSIYYHMLRILLLYMFKNILFCHGVIKGDESV